VEPTQRGGSTTEYTGLQQLQRSCAFAVVAVSCRRWVAARHHERRPGAPSVEVVQVAGGNRVARPRAEIDQYVEL
jgi:hypothetical protein